MQEENQKCIWEERSAKNFMYIPKCIGTPVNIFKLSKRIGKSIVSIMRKCPYCGRETEFIFPGK